MIFSQQTENVDENGNATVKITIKSLKYLARTKDVPTLDFDSSRQEQQTNALNKLIGQSYTIIITPTSEVIRTTGQDADKGLGGRKYDGEHGGRPIGLAKSYSKTSPDTGTGGRRQQKFAVGEKWNSTRTISFGMMGSNAFEKVYTLKAIEERDGRKTAIVEISGIPATVQKDATSPLTKLFDSNNNYTGTLMLDLNSGKIEQYSEKLQYQWVVADPQATEKESEPSTIKLGSMELYSLEKID